MLALKHLFLIGGLSRFAERLSTQFYGSAKTAPLITSVDSPVTPGGSIAVHGNVFYDPTTVAFGGGFINGSYASGAVTFVNAGEVDAVVSELSSGTYTVTATTTYGASLAFSSTTIDNSSVGTPQMNPGSPLDVVSGSHNGGTVVTITDNSQGTFTRDMDVRFDGVSLPVTFLDPSNVRVTTVAHAVGAVTVVVENGDGADPVPASFLFT